LAYYHYRSALPELLYSIKDIYGVQFITGTVDLFEKPSLLKAVTRFHLRAQKHLFFFLVILLYLIVFFKVFVHVFVRRKKDFPVLIPILVMGVLSLSYAYSVFDKSHFFQSVTLAYVCFGFVLHSLAQRRNMKSKVFLSAGLLFLALYVVDNFAMKGYFHTGSISTLYAIKKEGGGPIPSDRARIHVGQEELKLIDDLLRCFKGENGYLLPLYYDPMVNFLTERRNPTRFTHLLPALFVNASIQEEVIEAIEQYRIQYLLVWKSFWTGETGLSRYAPLLTEHVKRHYRMEREIGFYLIFSRSEEREGVESRRDLGYERQHIEAALGRARAQGLP
jgi:uncharacterized membrane protein YoaT (DUF817 family)